MDQRIAEETTNIRRQEKEYGMLQQQYAAAQRLIQRHMLLTQIVHDIQKVSLEDTDVLQTKIRGLLREVPATPLLYEIRKEATPLEVFTEEQMRGLIEGSEKDARQYAREKRKLEQKQRDPEKDGNMLFATQDIAMAFVGTYSEIMKTIAIMEKTGTTCWVDKIIIEPGSEYVSDELQLGIRLTAFIWDPQGTEGGKK